MFILNSFYYLFVYKLGIKYIRELVVQLDICICNKYIEAIRFSDSQDSVTTLYCRPHIQIGTASRITKNTREFGCETSGKLDKISKIVGTLLP
jgi:hypothetical protein